jgi:uncharacterized protein
MSEVRFACDAMLGGLARWLRLAGMDTSYDPALEDVELAHRALVEGRWLVTRDRALASRSGPRVVLLRATGVTEQLRELLQRLGLELDESRFFTRCSRCGGELTEVAPETVVEKVPPYVATHHARFVQCAACGQVYWPGTHHGRILERLRSARGSGPTTAP